MSEPSLATAIRPLDWMASAPSYTLQQQQQIRLWYLDRSRIPLHDSWLAADEIERTRRMQAERRDEFVSGRNALRLILGAFLDIDPAGVSIRISPRGKPTLAGEAIRFSFSHCNRKLLMGFSLQPLGIDLEIRKPRASFMRIAGRVFDQTCCDALRRAGAAERERLFFRYWSAHEAVQKLRGDGLFGERHLPAFVGGFSCEDFDAALASTIEAPQIRMHEELPEP
ncbi:MAG: 4'-phosphopantetheinyl transferase superfamily protein [Gammaproteobacteria bacterium]